MISQLPAVARRQADFRRGIALMVALLVGSAPGCLAHRAEHRASALATRDLLDVAALAPAVNADPAIVGERAKRSRAVRTAAVGPRDAAVAPAAVDTLPKPTARPATDDTDLPPLPATGPSADLPAQPPPGVALRAGETPPSIPSGGVYPIDLSVALRLADAENPRIAEARVGILSALAEQIAARALLLPTLNGGTNYHGHAGNLQRSSGRILNLSSQSLYVGGGARTLAAETINIPAVNVFSPLTDAIYEPLAASQRVLGARYDASATANSVLLEVANLYLELLGAEAVLEARHQTATEADDVAKIVADFVAQGESPPADADRSDAERRLLQAEILRAEEDVAVASARLSRRLNLDPAIRLQSLAMPLAPLNLIDPTEPAESLLQAALMRRPELGARAAQIGFAEAKLQEEKARPFLPTVWLGFSGGGFGGGSNLVPPDVGHFGGRTDFDVRAYWTLLNLGAGNLALQKTRRAAVGQAMAERSRVVNEVRSEVVSARAESLAQRQQVEVARAALTTAEGGYREDRTLLRESLSRPIEAVNSLRLLGRARTEYIGAITKSNQAQFALFVALGSPPPIQDVPAPAVAPPIATPLRTPITIRRESPPAIPPPGPPILGR